MSRFTFDDETERMIAEAFGGAKASGAAAPGLTFDDETEAMIAQAFPGGGSGGGPGTDMSAAEDAYDNPYSDSYGMRGHDSGRGGAGGGGGGFDFEPMLGEMGPGGMVGPGESIGGPAAPPRMIDLGNGQSVVLDDTGNVVPGMGISEPPVPGFFDNLGRGFMHTAANALPAGLPGVQAWQDAERLRSEGEGVGGFVGGAVGSLAGMVHPKNAAETAVSVVTGGALKGVPAVGKLISFVQKRLGSRAAQVLEHVIDEGTEEGVFSGIQQTQADADLWMTDPLAAFERTIGAMGLGAAGGALVGGPLGAVGRGAGVNGGTDERVRNPDEGGTLAGGEDVGGPVPPVGSAVAPVVGDQGSPAGAVAGNVGGVGPSVTFDDETEAMIAAAFPGESLAGASQDQTGGTLIGGQGPYDTRIDPAGSGGPDGTEAGRATVDRGDVLAVGEVGDVRPVETVADAGTGLGEDAGAEVAAGDEAHGKDPTAQRQPWEMTRREWSAELDRFATDWQGAGPTERNSKNMSQARRTQQSIEHKRWLRMGIPDTIDSDSAMPAQTPADHRDVIVKALAEGRAVPAKVLKDYPDLAATPIEQAPTPAPARAGAEKGAAGVDSVDAVGQPSPNATAGEPAAKLTLGARIRADADAKLKALDADLAQRRRALKPGQRLGHGGGIQYAALYAQIGVGHAVDAVAKVGEKAKTVAHYIKEEMKARGVKDKATQRKAVRIGRAMMKDATGEDGTIDHDRIQQVLREANTEVNTIVTPKGKAAERQAAKDAREGMVSESDALKARMQGEEKIRGQERRRTRQAVKDATEGTLTHAQALKGSMQREVKAVDRMATAAVREIRKANREGRREGRRVATETLSLKLDELRDRSTRAAIRARYRQKFKDGEQIRQRDYKLAHAEHMNELRGELIETIHSVVRPEKQASLIAMVPEVSTRVQFDRVIESVRREVDRSLDRQGRQTAREIKAYTKPKKLSTIPQDDTVRLQDDVKMIASIAPQIVADDTLTPRQRAKNLNVLKDQVVQIFHEQKRLNTVRIGGKLRNADTERASVVNAVGKAPEIAPLSEDRAERRVSRLRKLIRKYRHVGNVAKSLDGNWKGTGPVARVFRQFTRLADQKWKLRQDFMQQANDLVKARGYTSFAEFLAKVSGTLGRAGQEMVDVEIGGRKRISKGEAMGIYAMDQETRTRASRGQLFSFREAPSESFKLTNAQRAEIENALTAEEMAVVNDLKALYDTEFFGKLNRVSMALNGHTLRKIAGYWGISTNQNLTPNAALARGWRGYILRHLENVGYMQERENGRVPIFIEDFGDALIRRMNSASLVVTHAEALRSAEMVLRDPAVMTAIARHHGDDVNERLLHTLGELAETNQPATAAEGFNNLVRHLNSNVAAALTQVNPSTWGRQMGGIPMLASRIGWAGVAKGLPGMAKVKTKTLIANAPFFWSRYTRGVHTVHQMASGVEEVGEIGFGQAGAATLRQIAATAKNVGAMKWRQFGSDLGDTNKAWQQLRETMRWGNWFDAAPARVAWHYFDGEARKKHPAWTPEQRARWVATKTADVFRETQNTNDALTSSGWAQAGRAQPWLASFLSFTSDQHKKINLLEEAMMVEQPWYKPQFVKTATAVAASSIWSAGITWGWRLGLFAAGAAVAGRGPSEREQDEAQADAAWRFVSELASVFPLIGSPAAALAEMIARKGKRSGSSALSSPVSSTAGQMFDKAIEAMQAIDEALDDADEGQKVKAKSAADKFFWALVGAADQAAALAGAPVPPVRAVMTAAKHAGESKAEAEAGDVLVALKKAGLAEDWRYRWMLDERREYRKMTGKDREIMAQSVLDVAGRIRMDLKAGGLVADEEP